MLADQNVHHMKAKQGGKMTTSPTVVLLFLEKKTIKATKFIKIRTL